AQKRIQGRPGSTGVPGRRAGRDFAPPQARRELRLCLLHRPEHTVVAAGVRPTRRNADIAIELAAAAHPPTRTPARIARPRSALDRSAGAPRGATPPAPPPGAPRARA